MIRWYSLRNVALFEYANASSAICCAVNPGLNLRISETAAAAVWPRHAYAEARSTRACEKILQAATDLRHQFDRRGVPRQVRVRVADDLAPEEEIGDRAG